MSTIEQIDDEHLIEYITDMISTFRLQKLYVRNARYHHNTKYKDAPSVCKYGILTLEDLNRWGIRKDSLEFIKVMDDIDSHINGADGISLAVVGLPDIYPDEHEYNPYEPTKVDFIVSSDVRARRVSTHYGNEFIHTGSIGLSEMEAVDVRILELIRKSQEIGIGIPHCLLIEIYNYLIEISKALINNGYNIPLREMSEYDGFKLDIEKASNSPKILRKIK